jgi:hypothetical protein
LCPALATVHIFIHFQVASLVKSTMLKANNSSNLYQIKCSWLHSCIVHIPIHSLYLETVAISRRRLCILDKIRIGRHFGLSYNVHSTWCPKQSAPDGVVRHFEYFCMLHQDPNNIGSYWILCILQKMFTNTVAHYFSLRTGTTWNWWLF